MNLSFRYVLLFVVALSCIPAVSAAAEHSNAGELVYDRDGNIYTAEPSGGGEMVLVQDGDSHTPKWSPDGKKILYIRNTSLQTVIDDDGVAAEIGQPTDFYTVNRDGKDQRLLRHMEGVVSDPSWSPDGKLIGFFYQSKEEWLHQGLPSFQSGFFIMSSDGSESPRLISPDARDVDWSPDGKKLVFTVARPANHVALHTSNTDGGDEAQLLDEETFANSQHAKWSPDGSQIAFQGIVRRKMPDHKYVFQSTIFTVHPDGTHIRPLTYDLGWGCWHPWWTPATSQLNYSCFALPGCTPTVLKASPDQCTSRSFTVQMDDPHSKPVLVAEEKGIVSGTVPEVAPK